MRVRLKGINSVTKTLKDGTTVTYWYAWKGGPRLDGEPGDPEFIASYNRAVARLAAPSSGLLLNVLVKFSRPRSFSSSPRAPRTTTGKSSTIGSSRSSATFLLRPFRRRNAAASLRTGAIVSPYARGARLTMHGRCSPAFLRSHSIAAGLTPIHARRAAGYIRKPPRQNLDPRI